mgnify:FL=1
MVNLHWTDKTFKSNSIWSAFGSGRYSNHTLIGKFSRNSQLKQCFMGEKIKIPDMLQMVDANSISKTTVGQLIVVGRVVVI